MNDQVDGEVAGEVRPRVSAELVCGVAGGSAYQIAEARLLQRRGAPVRLTPWRIYQNEFRSVFTYRPMRVRLAHLIQVRRCAAKWLRVPPRSFPMVALWEDFPEIARTWIERTWLAPCPCVFVFVLGYEGAEEWMAHRRHTEPSEWITPDCAHEPSRALRASTTGVPR